MITSMYDGIYNFGSNKPTMMVSRDGEVYIRGRKIQTTYISDRRPRTIKKVMVVEGKTYSR